MKKQFRFLLMLCAGAVLNVAAFAQTSGTISGTVTDASGGVIPNAKVAARNLTNGERRDTVTNANGQYAFPSLPPGEYEIEIEQAGFAVTRRKVTLSVTERIAVDFALQPSSVKQQIVNEMRRYRSVIKLRQRVRRCGHQVICDVFPAST